ncbi:MAG: ABC transporter ATP-binding protein [Rhodospirillales bacterium]|jgi:iron(III) transport system ATP-binding protein|nr:ABC transporter ATP-binding protein [Rhodospirillales bacterium]
MIESTKSRTSINAGLSMQNISHAFGKQKILSNISIEVEAGQVACLLGPSGCGKTTLLRIAAGLEHLQHGRITIGERLVAEDTGHHAPPERRNVGLMFQDYALFPHLNVIKNIGFGIKGTSAQRMLWIDGALERMGLTGYADRYPHELSGGQQQRVALLRALAPEPSVLLLDEPFSGLDATRRASVREQTLGFLKDAGHSAMMVTHDPEEAMFMSDTLFIMDNGLLVQSGNPIEIYRNPKNAFVASLFGQTDGIEGTVGNNGKISTPVGTFMAPGLAEGSRVDILIRPEGVNTREVNSGSNGAVALRVISARPIGRSSHLCLGTQSNVTPVCTIHARVPGIHLPEPGSLVDAIIDPSQVFVFPKETP